MADRPHRGDAPLNTTGLRAFLAVLSTLLALPAFAQRVQFPSTLADGSDPSAPTSGFAGPAPSSPVAAPYSVYQGGPPPVTTIPSATPPPTFGSPTPPGPPTWDQYASPSLQSPSPAPYSPYAPSPYAPAPQPLYPEGNPIVFPQGGGFLETMQQPLRVLQVVRERSTWLGANGGVNKLGMSDTDLAATFLLPFGSRAPFLITPGFTAHALQGPVTTATNPADLPPMLYDGYVDGAWMPQFTPWLSANLGFRAGIYTDFHAVNIHSIRYMGRGLGVISLTPNLQLTAGVIYIDRNVIKLLPAGGLVWTPDPDRRYEIVFPSPKLARRWTTIGTCDVWGYVAGEYGGGAWTVQRAFTGTDDRVDINDIRASVGVESVSLTGFRSFFETGFVWDRQIRYVSGNPSRFDPSDTIMIRGGLYY